ncbi:hypothetical protein MPTK1_8g07050 [Marchantia polymorpha subsp. ruderalis]|uniref:Uncharacterized protein n=1 Tax=Marchantia polymorpha TaxID=3197 RepID=A0A2R6XIC4_MARPO|nr:hypothetical protein MARPO_0013s0087 [Marchantia polymorpha]BBN18985.1 hypothetical protein Mp_8g07050 [Marchantia polymorpha subsp. ruderalis]|eukprot:PTQ45861.1 hypothetical protein MARPO_0013s0087 [Marchantia polymorpha]
MFFDSITSFPGPKSSLCFEKPLMIELPSSAQTATEMSVRFRVLSVRTKGGIPDSHMTYGGMVVFSYFRFIYL